MKPAWPVRCGKLASGLSAEIQFVPGYSFNSVASSEKNVVRAQVAVPQAVTDISNSFAWETRLAGPVP
jgi:hypothetical protein